jgi:ATP-dependent DNA helicase HFM1/MER3
MFKFDQSYRPVKVETHVVGYKEATNAFMFDRNLNYRLHSVIHEYSGGRQSLVFCSSRNGCSQAAKQLLNDAGRGFVLSSSAAILSDAAAKISNPSLSDFVKSGIAFHHAGLAIKDRSAVEKLFLQGHLRVLFATSTLAVGVNLPAHLLIIKGTQYYSAESHDYTDYSNSAVEQMIGRAGRPQFDTSAVAVIMTQQKKKNLWEQMVTGSLIVESHFNSYLVEHLNAEIALETIKNIDMALEWLKSTFLWVRVHKNPQHYGLAKSASSSAIESFLTRASSLCSLSPISPSYTFVRIVQETLD